MVTPGAGITQADMNALALLANTKLLPLVNAAITADQNGWRTGAGWTYDSQGILLNVTGKNFYDIPTSRAAGTWPITNPQPAYLFDPAVKNWHDELNRIRGDAMEMVLNFNYTGAANIFWKATTLLSGPWIVGINDPTTWVDPQLLFQPSFHMLFATLNGNSGGCTNPNFTMFKNVKFWFWDSIASPIGISTGSGRGIITSASHNFGANPTSVNYSIPLVAALGGTIQGSIKIEYNNFVGTFNITDTSTIPIVWSTGPSPNAGKKLLIGTITPTSIAASTQNIIFTATMVGAGTFVTNPVNGEVYWNLSTQIIFNSSSTQHTDANAINFISDVPYISIADVPGSSEFVVNGVHASAVYLAQSSGGDPSTILGVWTANTLPVPGRNVYCDQDMPPFIDTAYVNGTPITPNNIQVAISKARDGIAGAIPLSSSMRCIVEGDFSAALAKFNPVISARPTSPTPYPVLRDTDVVPFDLGFNQNEFLNTNNGLAGATGSKLIQGGIAIGSAATNIALNVIAGGTGLKGWRGGNLGYGTALASSVRIFIGKVGPIDAGNPSTYDFSFTGNTFSIPSNAPAGYLATVLNRTMNYAVQNLTAGDLNLDIVEEVDYNGIAPARVFNPPLCECFSYSIDGAPRIFDASVTNYNFNKRIPSAGYSIYKIRATRLPVAGANNVAQTPTTGAAITATIGAYALQLDGSIVFIPFINGFSNFTITIPLNTRDSGDVEVFWPLLAGCELVYQCSQQIILEAWVDFQPAFFNSLYGVESGPIVPPFVEYLFNPTAFQYALGFCNKFDQTQAGYPYKDLETTPAVLQGYSFVQFPLSAEIYNDLTALLNLI